MQRIQRLAMMRQRAEVFDLAQRLAPELAISTEELMAEAWAQAQARRAEAAGVVTRAQQLPFAAAELGIPEDELRTELSRVRAIP